MSIAEIRRFFEPKSVALIGASRSPAKFSALILNNLLTWGYGGKIFPVNPYTGELQGLKCYPALGEIREEVDLAIIALPAFSVPGALRDCARNGIKGAIIISSGFNEAGEEGVKRQREIVAIAKEAGMRFLGPNTTGVLNPEARFTSTWNMVPSIRSGPVAFIAQTGMFAGVMLAAILTTEGFGVSRVAGLGNKLDVAEADILEYLEQDDATRVIMIYMEGVKEGRRFLEVAGRVGRRKPIILLKGGRTEAGARASRSHTGSLATKDDILEGALRQIGVVRAMDMEELVDYAKIFAFQPLPLGHRIGLVSMSGGSAVMASDALVEAGLSIADLQPQTLAQIGRLLPEWAIVTHPLDLEPLAERVGRFEAYKMGLELVLADPGVDGCLLSISGMEEGDVALGEVMAPVCRGCAKPISVHIMAEKKTYELMAAVLEEQGIPVYFTQRRAAKALAALYRYRSLMADGRGSSV